jgi:hypothetical protein
MVLKPETEAHLVRGERNRAVARALCDPRHSLGLQPPPLDWAAIAAFYAAVHYVNAFLWERLSQASGDHRVRRNSVARVTPLNRVLHHYERLTDLGWNARYTATFQPPATDTQDAANARLDAIRNVVYQSLGLSAP